MAARVETWRGSSWWRLWALAPIALLAVAVGLFVSSGSSLVGLIGKNPPPADEFDIRRVELRPGEIRIRVTNPQSTELRIGAVTIDDAIVPYRVDGTTTLSRLRSATVVVPYDWVEDEPLAVGVTSSTGIQTTAVVAAAVATPTPSPGGFLGYGIIGLLVGVLPVALGLLWLPSLRRADKRWQAAFMALTAGLLSFLGVEALFEAFQRQAILPGALGGAGLVLLGVAVSYLTMTFVASRASSRGRELSGLGLATLVALGIGVHNLGEGLAIGASFAVGELTLGTFLIVGFMVHNVTEGLGIATPIAEGRAAPRIGRLAALALLAGAPAIAGTWIGGYATNDILAVVFFAAAAGAALEVVVEVLRYVARRAPGGLQSGWAIGGFLAGILAMYATGVLAG